MIKRRLPAVTAAGALVASVLLAGCSAVPGGTSAGNTNKSAGNTSTGTGTGNAGTGDYVSLGDSYTSGPLIPDSTGTPPGCLRSDHDYPALVAAALHMPLRNVSCSGATLADMTGPQSVISGTNQPQLRALSTADRLVTVQIGGNDIGFTRILITCALLSFTDPWGSPCQDHYTSGGGDRLTRAIAGLSPKIATLLRDIRRLAPDARILVVGYPDILPGAGSCWPMVPVASGDVAYLRGIEIQLNQMLASEAAVSGATFVDTYTDSIGHDACQRRGTKWIEGIIPTSSALPVHPNELGEQAMARQVLAALR